MPAFSLTSQTILFQISRWKYTSEPEWFQRWPSNAHLHHLAGSGEPSAWVRGAAFSCASGNEAFSSKREMAVSQARLPTGSYACAPAARRRADAAGAAPPPSAAPRRSRSSRWTSRGGGSPRAEPAVPSPRASRCPPRPSRETFQGQVTRAPPASSLLRPAMSGVGCLSRTSNSEESSRAVHQPSLGTPLLACGTPVSGPRLHVLSQALPPRCP